MENIVDVYITNVLVPNMKYCGINEIVTRTIASDIKNRLSALLLKWNDIEYRSTILLHGVEEGLFYEPESHIDIRSLVVVGIRNSLIEDAASTIAAAKNLGLEKPSMSDLQIKMITSDAINFFSKYNLGDEVRNIQNPDKNPFENLPRMYPTAWNAMKQLYQCKSYISFEPYKVGSSQINSINTEVVTDTFVEVQSGIDPKINDQLGKILENICSGQQSFFFSDSFKMITRHPEKLYKIIDSVLSSNAALVTINYYISDGYVSKRANLLKPAHSEKEIPGKLANKFGLRKAHQLILKHIGR